MNKVTFALLAVVIAASVARSPSFPQAAPQGRQGGPTFPPQQIDLGTAKKMAAVAEAAAAAANQHVGVCIMDARGDMVLFERMDTVNPISGSTAQGKARAVVVFGIPTGQIADAMRSGKPISATIKAPLAGAGEMSLMRGGLPIIKNGQMIGSIAVGGSASESDEQFAQAGVDAVTEK